MRIPIHIRRWFASDQKPWSGRLTRCIEKARSYPVSKVHGANMGPIWGRQDPGGPKLAPWTLLSGKAHELHWESKTDPSCPTNLLYNISDHSLYEMYYLLWMVRVIFSSVRLTEYLSGMPEVNMSLVAIMKFNASFVVPWTVLEPDKPMNFISSL